MALPVELSLHQLFNVKTQSTCMEDTSVSYLTGQIQGEDNAMGWRDGLGAQIYRKAKSNNGRKQGEAAEPSNSLACTMSQDICFLEGYYLLPRSLRMCPQLQSPCRCL